MALSASVQEVRFLYRKQTFPPSFWKPGFEAEDRAQDSSVVLASTMWAPVIPRALSVPSLHWVGSLMFKVLCFWREALRL